MITKNMSEKQICWQFCQDIYCYYLIRSTKIFKIATFSCNLRGYWITVLLYAIYYIFSETYHVN